MARKLVRPALCVATLAVGLVAAARPAYAESDRYYRRTRGVGIFHSSRLLAGGLVGQVPDLENGTVTTPGATRNATMVSLAFDAVFLGLPSSFGHFHGIELSTGMRGAPFDWWLTAGTAVTLFNLGDGGPLSLRVGGGFGGGFNFAHGFGYVRGRAALVVVPETIDAEVSAVWTPPSASTGGFDERVLRVSAWWRTNPRKARAFEAYVEAFRRADDTRDHAREVDGIGGGVGMTLF